MPKLSNRVQRENYGSNPSFLGRIKEQTATVPGTALDPDFGTVQSITLTGNTTFTDNLEDGEYLTLHIDDGTGYTIVWPTMQWMGGGAPTLETSGWNIVTVWKVGSTLFGTSNGATS